MTITGWTVLLIALAGSSALTVALLTMREIIVIAREVPNIEMGPDPVGDALQTSEVGVNILKLDRVARHVLVQFRGNWRTRTAATLVIASIALGTAVDILAAVK